MEPDATDIRQITHVEPKPDRDAPGATVADWYHDGGTIVFAINPCQIGLIDLDGGNLREVPTEAGYSAGVDLCEGDPSFTPDGQSIVYGRFDGETEDIWIMNVDGTDRRLVTEACGIDPNVSPDGTLLSCKGDDGALWVVGMDGTDARLVSPPMDIGYKHDWAPDGSAIVFVDSADLRPEGVNIATVAPDGTDLRYLTHYTESDWYPGFGGYSPDGTTITYRLEHGEGEYAYFVMAADGTDVRQVTEFSQFRPRHLDWGAAPAGSEGADPMPTSASGATPTVHAATWNYVALGDSWPEGAHCGGCLTFVDLWADALTESTGREIVLTDLTGSQEPGLPPGTGETSTSLLASLRFNAQMREAIRSADIILISSGSNEIGLPDDPPAGGDCSGEALFDCIDALGRMWSVNHDAVLDEIELLREGKHTVIRFVNDANLFLADPGLAGAGSEEDIANMDLVFQALTGAMCGAAAAHGAACVDVRPIINGPTMDEPGDENADSTMQGITDALMATGLPELE
jgi:hypothetical protein